MQKAPPADGRGRCQASQAGVVFGAVLGAMLGAMLGEARQAAQPSLPLTSSRRSF